MTMAYKVGENPLTSILSRKRGEDEIIEDLSR